MNRNNRSGGIKFRELDYNKSSPSKQQTNKTPLRSKADVLKLFADASVASKKENSSDNICTAENNSDNAVVEDINFEDPFEDEDKTERGVELTNEASVVKQETKPKIDFAIREKQKIQSNVVGTSTIRKENTNSGGQPKSCHPPQNAPVADGKKIYNVMIGKISTRKHKQWDSDGILEVSGKSAVLKDVDGKFMGRTAVKPETIEEGFRLCIGGKEIEIVELALQEDIQASHLSNEQNSKNESSEPLAKKAKLSKGFVPVKSGSLHFNYEPLIMPHPPLDIEWSEGNDVQKIHEVSVDGCLASVLRPHQREGIVFLYKCIMGMNSAYHKGAILADEMGLGKTLQCISLIWTLLKKGPSGKPVLKRVLIVAPSSLCGNWNKEFRRWLGTMKIAPYVVEGKQKVKDFTKTPRACVMIISYEMFVRNVEDINNLNFDLLICDEGHRLKNSEVKTLKFLSQLRCKRRILVTGTPVQNDLTEFYTLANFVNPGVFGTFSEYKSYYEHKIVASQRATADEDEVVLGQERAKELYERSKTFILRRTNTLINKYLPQKHELVIFCKPTVEQNNLYSLITDYWFNRSLMDGNVIPLTVITALKKVCNHPYLFTSEKSNILDEVLPSVPTNLSAINTSYAYSSKVKIVQAIFQSIKRTNEKVVLVSYFTQTLDFLEKVCCTEGLQFCRLDGNTPATSRTKLVDRFNSKDNTFCRVFLLSAKAGGVGLNLVGASRLILFDSDWNPANDAQAMARIWRDGQKRSVYIYRLLTTGTIEEKIYQRQISKTGLSEAVVDANHISSLKLSASELKDLFTLDSQTLSVTHDLMDCSCTGCGDIPYKNEENSTSEDARDCQFDLKKKQPQQQITMNQLLSWQHYKQPTCPDLMKELMIQQVQNHITFIFKNSVEN